MPKPLSLNVCSPLYSCVLYTHRARYILSRPPSPFIVFFITVQSFDWRHYVEAFTTAYCYWINTYRRIATCLIVSILLVLYSFAFRLFFISTITLSISQALCALQFFVQYRVECFAVWLHGIGHYNYRIGLYFSSHCYYCCSSSIY